ncbi:hypothetical protein [Flavobacterium sp.]|uniref:hypothetical protein n=1 Tax=Flavobacterium sp. TaxID=239 RepID=UPI002607C8E9|nr:hypothetical protein [Flavobacterium sp.]
MEFRHHPIIEGLKISEDGTSIKFNNEDCTIKSYQYKHTRNPTLIVHINRKPITVIKLVCEAWHGVSPSGEHAARRIDETKGNHYSNLHWGKKGMTVSSAKGVVKPTAKMSPDVYQSIMKRSTKESIRSILKELNISENRFYQYRKKHVKKEVR